MARARQQETVMEIFEEGEYVLLVDNFTDAKDVSYVRGDTLVLDEGEATRLGNGKAIAPVGSLEARQATASTIEDEGERARKMKGLQAEALEERAKQLRREAEEEDFVGSGEEDRAHTDGRSSE